MSLGIEKLKLAVGFGIKLTESLVEKLDDKKLTLAEALGLLPNLVGVVDVIKSADEIWDELKDLKEDELDELHQYVVDEFDVAEDDVEEVVEDAFSLVAAIGNLAFSIKKLD